MKTAKVDCEAERSFCRELRVTAYPTVILYLSPNERYEISSHAAAEIIQEVNSLREKNKYYVHDEF